MSTAAMKAITRSGARRRHHSAAAHSRYPRELTQPGPTMCASCHPGVHTSLLACRRHHDDDKRVSVRR